MGGLNEPKVLVCGSRVVVTVQVADRRRKRNRPAVHEGRRYASSAAVAPFAAEDHFHWEVFSIPVRSTVP